MERKLAVVLFFLTAFLIPTAIAESEFIESTSSLSFERQFSMVEGSVRTGIDQVTFDIVPNVELSFSEDMIISSKASTQYAERGKSTILALETSNVVSSFELDGDLTLAVSWDYPLSKGSKNLPVVDVNFKYSISEHIGSPQDVVLGDYLVFSGTIPLAGVYFSINMKPIVQYTPVLSGTLYTLGPASVDTPNLVWNSESVTAYIDFTDTAPVDLFLSSPTLTLSNFNMYLKFSAVVVMVPTPSATFDVVSLGDEVMTSSDVNLLSFEPNLFVLYTELGNTLDSLTATLAQIESAIEQVEDEIQSVNSQLSSISTEVSLLSEKQDSLEDSITQLELGSPGIVDGSQVTEILDDLKSLNSSIQDLTFQYDTTREKVDSFEESLNQVNQSLTALKSGYVVDEVKIGKGESPILYIAMFFSIIGCATGVYSVFKTRNT